MSNSNRSYILFDDNHRDYLLPFTFIRPVSEIRVGILTIREKWEKWSGTSFSYLTQDYLQSKYPLVIKEENLIINGSITPNKDLLSEVQTLQLGEALVNNSVLVAVCLDRTALLEFDGFIPKGFSQRIAASKYNQITKLWHIYRLNGEELLSDYNIITSERQSLKANETNHLINPDNIFIEDGVTMDYVTINASTGPVYLGKNTILMEGSLIRGPFALCEGSKLKLGTRIYGPTTIGPYSKAGGEITNSVFMGYSNKVHEGYVGNSVIGEWCNIGGGSNTSNLKNNYTLVKLWNYATGKFEDTELQFCGLFMGDYSRCGINTMFNTGTVVGLSSNIYGPGFPGSFIPSFSWGGASGFETYRLNKAIETIEMGMALNDIELNETDKNIIEKVFMITGNYRKTI